ncbi:ribosomal protein L7/L12 [Xanthomonas translucens]
MNRTQPPPAIAEALARGEIIKAIKLLRAQSGMDLRSAKLQVDAWLQAGAAQTVADMLNRHADTTQAQTETSMVAGTYRLSPAALSALAQGQLLQAIKLTREQHPGMGLREAKEVVERYRDRNAPRAGSPPTVAGGDRSGAWLWGMLVLLLAAAAAFWWLRGG